MVEREQMLGLNITLTGVVVDLRYCRMALERANMEVSRTG